MIKDLQNQVVDSRSLRRRSRGRPRKPDPMERTNVRIPPDVLDRLCKEAFERKVPLAQVIREALSDHVGN